MTHAGRLKTLDVWARTQQARHTVARPRDDDNDPNIGGALLLFGAELRKLRLKRHLSQEGLAELVGLHRNYVGMVERGECNISLITVVALARVLSVKPARLMASIC
jgi:DNA-binding XRE family transcriptional regulator